MHLRPQQGCPTAARACPGRSPSVRAHQGETADHAAGRRRARHGGGLRAAALVGAGAAGAADRGRRRAGGGRTGGAGVPPGDRADPDRRVPAGVLRRPLGRCRRQRLRHAQRRADGVADRSRPRPGSPLPGGLRHPSRPLHRPSDRLRARPRDQRRCADRPRRRPRRRLAQGRGRLAAPRRTRVRERPGQPGADGWRDQPGQGRRRRRAVAPAQPRLPLRLRGAADRRQGRLRHRDHQRGARRAGDRAGGLPHEPWRSGVRGRD